MAAVWGLIRISSIESFPREKKDDSPKSDFSHIWICYEHISLKKKRASSNGVASRPVATLSVTLDTDLDVG